MFFNITNDTDALLTEHYKFGEYTLYLDEGWTRTGTVWRKGYSVESELQDIDPGEAEPGNYCIIVVHNNTLSVYHDDCRGFPIYYNKDGFNNLYPGTKEDQVWVGQSIRIINDDILLVFGHESYDLSIISPEKKYLHELILHTTAYIDYQVIGYRKYNTDFVIPKTGGIDSLTLQAISHTEATGSSDYNNLVLSDTKLANHLQKTFWGYKQLSAEFPSIGTGFCGDEYLMRNPQYVAWYLMHYGIDLSIEYNKKPNTYMEGFTKHKYLSKIQKAVTDTFENEQSLYASMLNYMFNDHQMWHLDNVITFTPFKNMYVPVLLLNMKPEDALAQVTDAAFQKEIISRYNPALLNNLDVNKNEYAP